MTLCKFEVTGKNPEEDKSLINHPMIKKPIIR